MPTKLLADALRRRFCEIQSWEFHEQYDQKLIKLNQALTLYIAESQTSPTKTLGKFNLALKT